MAVRQVKIVINFGNAASENEEALPALLRELARRFEAGQDVEKVMDSNGRSVGTVDFWDE